MSDALRTHIERYLPLTDADWSGILSFFKPQQIRKKENLLTEGKVCRCNYFVEKGLLRMFFINNSGVEQTTQFAMETWWIADYASFESQKPATFHIQAVESTEVLALDHAAQEQLLRAYPVMERYFRLVHQRAHAAAQFRVRVLYDMSREELYLHFAERYPDFVQRVPQYLLASFLGFTPEYLSEIRRKKRS
jgi:CRP-like cAMP-binding protein